MHDGALGGQLPIWKGLEGSGRWGECSLTDPVGFLAWGPR